MVTSTLVLAAALLAFPYIGQAAKVVIDPGHGGSDPGAVGVNGLYEKTVNNDISYRLKDILLAKGYEVVMTRDVDKTMSLQARVEFARSADADLFVSVHANAHPSSAVRGTMVLYHDASNPNPSYPASPEMKALSPESKRLAQHVLSSMLEQVPNTNRGLLQSSAYVVRMGNIPSILVETAFLSNAQDAKMLASSSVRDKYAVGIANGILQYLPPTFSDIGRHWAKDSIIRLNEQGIAGGDEGKFYPDRPLTRAELMAFAERAFGFSGAKSQVSVTEAAPAEAPAPEESGHEAANGDEAVTEDVYEADSASGEASDSDSPAQPAEGGASDDGAGADEGADAPAATAPDAPAATAPDAPAASPEPADVPAAAFADLPEAHWSYETMNQAVEHGILRGYPDGTIRPDAPVTRAEVAVVLDRLIGTTLSETSGSKFRDVSSKNWAYASIMRLSGSGIVRGVADRLYGPDRNVTRAEIATMVDRQLTRGTLQ